MLSIRDLRSLLCAGPSIGMWLLIALTVSDKPLFAQEIWKDSTIFEQNVEIEGRTVRFWGCQFKKGAQFSNVYGDSSHLFSCYGSHFQGVRLLSLRKDSVSFEIDTISRYLEMVGDFAGPLFYRCVFAPTSKIYLNATAVTDFTFQFCTLPDSIFFQRVDCGGVIRLHPSQDGRRPCLVISHDFPIEKLRVNASQFRLAFDSTVSSAQKEFFLSRYVGNQKAHSSSRDVEAADIAYKNLLVEQGDFLLRLQKYLWNYGYQKSRLILWMAGTFLLFFLINLLVFKRLITDVYPLAEIADEYHRLRNPYLNPRFYILVLTFSAIIYFGFRIDLSILRYRKIKWALHLLFFYVAGLYFLFFVAAIMLKAG